MQASAVVQTSPGKGRMAQYILALDGLRDGGEMTQKEITDAVGLPWERVRGDMYHLVAITGQLHRLCGIGTAPARYHLPRLGCCSRT